MMKAVYITKPGGPEVLKLTHREKPAPKVGEVLIQVHAVGVNRPDVMQRMGRYPAPKDAPADIPGLEIAGIVKQAEAGMGFKPDDRVCALLSGGGYAEYAAVPASQCLPIPEGLSFEEAASLPETFFTVWNNVFDIGQFKPGDTVLVHGGTSGIGVAAIQMITAMGGRVLATAGTEEKCQTCTALGAALAVNYREEDFVTEINAFTQGEGVDIVLDMIGGHYTNKNIKLLKPEGRLIMINAMNGRMAEVDLIQVMTKRLMITGSTLRSQSPEYKGRIAGHLIKHIWPLIPAQIKPIVYRTFPLEQAFEAHRLMESSVHIGKIILKI